MGDIMDIGEVNNIDGLIKFIENGMGIKLPWYEKIWMKFMDWADNRIKRLRR